MNKRLKKLFISLIFFSFIGLDICAQDNNSRSTFISTNIPLNTVNKQREQSILVNHLGYLANQPKNVISNQGKKFQLIDGKGNVVYEGTMDEAGGAFGKYVLGDFSDYTNEGVYRIKIGRNYSRWFSIGEEALKDYRNAIYLSSINWFQKQRSGNTTLNWEGIPVHVDDGRRSDNLEHQDFSGGWKDASDRRKYMVTGTVGLLGLLEIKSNLKLDWDKENILFDEIKWGNDFFLKMQDPAGYLYSFSAIWPNQASNSLTDNIAGNEDDRYFHVTRSALFVHYNFIAGQAKLYQLYKEEFPEYARKCLKAGILCFEYCEKNFAEMNQNTKKLDPARTYVSPQTDMRANVFDNYASSFMCGLELYKATQEKRYKEFAIEMASRLMELQETNYINNQNKIKGFFYEDETKSSFVQIAISNQFGLIGLCELYKQFPEHPESSKWKKSIISYIEDYLLPLANKNAFMILPHALWQGNFNNQSRMIGDGLYFRYFKGPPEYDFFSGRSATICGLGAGLAKAGELFENDVYKKYAWKQLDWILGCNPFDRTLITGIGYNQLPFYRGTSGLIPIDGGVMNGITGTEDDIPEEPNNSFSSSEYWIPNNAHFLLLLANLLDGVK